MSVTHHWYDVVSVYSHADTLRQLYRVDRRILCGGAIAGPTMRDFLRSLGITHVLSADQNDGESGLWPRSHFKWTPFSALPDVPMPQVRLHDAARFVESVLAEPDRTLYIHDDYGHGRSAALGYLALRVGGMPAEMARQRVFRARGDGPQGARRAQNMGVGWTPPVVTQHLEDVDRCLATFVSLLSAPSLRA